MTFKTCWVIEISTLEPLLVNLRDIIIKSMNKEGIGVLNIEEIYAFSFKNKEAFIHKVVVKNEVS